MNDVPQLPQVGRVHPKKGALDVFYAPNIYPVRQNITHRQQAIERVDDFACLHLFYSLGQSLAEQRNARETNRFQDTYFTAAKVNFTCHGSSFLAESNSVERLILEPSVDVGAKPLP